jgi:L-2-hydroxyglutarate oxidase LhgO
MKRYDLVIVGAGIVGLGCARELLIRQPRLKVAILDREPVIAAHQSSHNSGVIHAGIYYRTGSLKAKLCVAGTRSMTRYCAERGIEVRQCGKLIIATREDELGRLRDLRARGESNGVAGLELVGPERIREIEPHCVGVAALWSPATAIVDYGAVAASYAAEVVAAGGEIFLDQPVLAIDTRTDGVVVRTKQNEFESSWVLGCAGLWADRVAQMDGGPSEPKLIPFRGSYWRLRPARRNLVRGLIYPVPDPAFPFLGVHFTPRINNDVWLGPNAVLALARDGYARTDVSPRDVAGILGSVGFRHFAFKYWRMGLDEFARDLSHSRLLAELRRYVPELEPVDILPGPSGVRAQPLTPEGGLIDDFVIDERPRSIHIRHAPSPAATSSLEIARVVADRAVAKFALTA